MEDAAETLLRPGKQPGRRGRPIPSASREKLRRDREFDLRTFRVAVVVVGVPIALALWLIVAVRGHRMLPSRPTPSRTLNPASPAVELLRRGWAMPGDSLCSGGQFTG